VHRPLNDPMNDVDVLTIGDVAPVLSVNLGAFLRDDIDDLRLEMPAGPLAGWVFSRSPDHRSLIIANAGRCLRAVAPGDAVDLVDNDTGPFSRFLPLTPADLGALREIGSSRWLVKSDDVKQPVHGHLSPGFMLAIGSLGVDLRWNLPLELSEFPHRLTLLRDGWRVDQVYRYRPLVYYAAFGDPAIIQQFALNLRSLVTAGEYEGDVAILTDRSIDEIRALAPPMMRGSLVVLRSEARDRIGGMAARLAISGWRDAWTFQPLLYVDTDIIFDRPITPMLYAIAQSDRIAAPMEPHASLAESVFVGSNLLLDDGCDPGSSMGFNSGTLGIPNLGRHSHTIELIGRILRNRASILGRHSMPVAEQPIANYVSFRLANFDTDLITPYVRLSGDTVDPQDRQGIVQFCWVPGTDKRVEAMGDYLAQVDALDGRPAAMDPAAWTAPAVTSDVVSPEEVAAFSMSPILDFESVIQSLKK
jgi:hypothetical protein